MSRLPAITLLSPDGNPDQRTVQVGLDGREPVPYVLDLGEPGAVDTLAGRIATDLKLADAGDVASLLQAELDSEAAEGAGLQPMPDAPAVRTPSAPKRPMAAIPPERIADLFLESQRSEGVLTLRRWNGSWWGWQGGCYRELRPESVVGRLSRFVRSVAENVTRNRLQDVLLHVTAEALTEHAESPCWAEDRPGDPPARELLATSSELVHLPTGTRYPATPRFFTTAATDFRYDPDPPEPTAWFDFLAQLWPDDPEPIDTLQQWFGLCLLPDIRFHKILALIGPRRSGKGTIASVLRAVVGSGNVAGPSLSSLASQFGLWPLVGKSVGIIADARLSRHTNSGQLVERLLNISGADWQTVDRKHAEPIHLRLDTRLVLLSNELPRLDDASGALAGRVLLLPMSRTFYGREDLGLYERLYAERAGILRWAVDGWRKLQAAGRFTQPESGRQHLDELQRLTSPISAFVADCCEVSAEATVEKTALYHAYRNWANESGAHPWSLPIFSRELRAAFTQLTESKPRLGAQRLRLLHGITLVGGDGDGF